MSIYSLTFDLLGLFSSGAPQLSISYGDQELGVEYAYAGTTSVNLTIDTGSMGFDSTLLRFSFIESSGEVGDAVRLTNLKIDGNDLDYSDFSTDRGAYFHDGILNLSRGGYTEYDASVYVTDTMLNPPSGDVTPAATVTGTTGNDNRLYGTNDAGDVIDALAGNDYVVALDGDDTVNAGDGDDYVKGQGGVDTLNGDAGNDRLYGGAGDDIVNGGDDDDRVYGNDGNDTVRGDDGNDRVYGNAGDDDLYGGNGNDHLSGGDGADELYGEAGDDHLFGGAGDDILYGGNNNDRLRGNDGNDELHGGLGADDLNGQDGNDILYGNSGNDTLNGEYGDDDLNGDENDDFLIGGQGADTLDGGGGNDIIYGGGMSTVDQYTIRDGSAFGLSGVMYLEETQSFYRFVSAGADYTTAEANAAASMLNGVGGHLVTITSQFENDFVQSYAQAGGSSTIMWIGAQDRDVDGEWVWSGGAEAGTQFWQGDETGSAVNNAFANFIGSNPEDGPSVYGGGMQVSSGLWTDDPQGGSRSYMIEWDADDVMADNSIDTINGGTGNDTIYGGGGNDILDGDGGHDIIYGGVGDDDIVGDTGNDALYGQDGNDTIDGGLGTDSIYGGDGNDIITDFFGTNTLHGNAGNDSITGGSGTDYIYGGTGVDIIDANGGNDWIYLANGDFVAGESITGDTGTDTIVLTNATNVDFTTGTISVENLSGSEGNDDVTVSTPQLTSLLAIDLNGGTDTLNVVASGNITASTIATISDVEVGNLVGTSGGDTITLTGAQLDTILIGSGTINLAGGTDTINLTSTSSDLNALGGTNASIQGLEAISASGAGAGVTITLSGQTENFTITGSAFNDNITGGSGDDIIDTGLGSDIVNAGAGNDTVTASDADDTLDGGAGTDTLILSGNFADYGITLLGSVYTFIDNVGSDGTDSVTLFENFQFADGTLVEADLINVAPVITSNGGGATASISYAENGTGSITTVTATDANPSNTITYSISGGTDAALFTISAGGVLSFISSPDYETALDSGANNVYDVEVTASDGTLVDVQNIAVTVTDVNEGDVGNSTGTAGTLTVGGSVLYEVDSGGDRDWFAIDLVGGTKYAFWARGTPTEAANSTDPRIYGIYDASSSLVSGGDDDGGIGYDSLLYFTPSSTGTYYIDAGAFGTVVGEILLSAFEGGSTISGSFFGSTHNGGAFADYIDGNGGNDTLNGNGGSDILEGGSGNDILNGGDGSDVLYGDTGSDTFVFDNFNGVDSVVDFNAGGGDRIDISSLLTGFTIGVDDIDDFVQFQEVSGSTIMRIDANGTVGGSNFVEVAVLEGNTGEVVQTLYDNGDIIV